MKVGLLGLLTLSLFCFACGASDDENPCKGYSYYHRSGNVIATLALDTQNKNWLPHPTNPLFFVEFAKVGAQATLKFVRSAILNNNYQVSAVKKNDTDDYCQIPFTYYDVVACESELFTYTGSPGAVFDMKVTRTTKPGNFIVGDIFDSINFFSGKETMRLSLGSSDFDFNPDEFISGPNQMFHPMLTIGTSNFDSIFELWKPLQDTVTIVPQGLYYSKKEGIIGFYLTQKKEVWVRK